MSVSVLYTLMYTQYCYRYLTIHPHVHTILLQVPHYTPSCTHNTVTGTSLYTLMYTPYCYRYLTIGETNRCYIELDTPKLSADEMESIERTCNELIRQGVPMTPMWYSTKDPKLEAVSITIDELGMLRL